MLYENGRLEWNTKTLSEEKFVGTFTDWIYALVTSDADLWSELYKQGNKKAKKSWPKTINGTLKILLTNIS